MHWMDIHARWDDGGPGRLWDRSLFQRESVEAVQVHLAVFATVGAFTVERRAAW